MKIIVFITSFLFSLGWLGAQNIPVSQLPEAKKVVIEEFTAFRCGNCPLGHEIVNDIGENLGEQNVLVIAYHVGSLAEPQNAGDPDFRTSDGDDMQSFFGATGTPSGPVNRSSFSNSNFELSANNWTTNSNSTAMVTAEANVALDAFINHNTREVTVNTEVYYTTNSSDTHYLTVGYLEEGVISSQTTYNTNWNSEYFYPNGDYYHRHVFRGFINGAIGTSLDASSTGTISNNYTFTVPADINGQPVNIYSLEFFAIIHDGLNGPTDSEIINAAKTTDSFVNVPELEASELIISPNPSNGIFTVESLENTATVTITDLSGRSIPFIRDWNRVEVMDSGYFLLTVKGSFGARSVSIQVF